MLHFSFSFLRGATNIFLLLASALQCIFIHALFNLHVVLRALRNLLKGKNRVSERARKKVKSELSLCVMLYVARCDAHYSGGDLKFIIAKTGYRH